MEILRILTGILLLSTLSLHAVDRDLLRVEASFLPKTILMDYDFKKRLNEGVMEFVIVYDANDYTSARELKKMIDAKYGALLDTYSLHVSLIKYKNIKTIDYSVNGYFFFSTGAAVMKQSIAIANAKKALSFVYNEGDLDKGAMISVRIAKKIKPIINMNALRRENISLRPIMMKIADIFDNKRSLINESYYDKFQLYNV